jgi:hypothetical protein
VQLRLPPRRVAEDGPDTTETMEGGMAEAKAVKIILHHTGSAAPPPPPTPPHSPSGTTATPFVPFVGVLSISLHRAHTLRVFSRAAGRTRGAVCYTETGIRLQRVCICR